MYSPNTCNNNNIEISQDDDFEAELASDVNLQRSVVYMTRQTSICEGDSTFDPSRQECIQHQSGQFDNENKEMSFRLKGNENKADTCTVDRVNKSKGFKEKGKHKIGHFDINTKEQHGTSKGKRKQKISHCDIADCTEKSTIPQERVKHDIFHLRLRKTENKDKTTFKNAACHGSQEPDGEINGSDNDTDEGDGENDNAEKITDSEKGRDHKEELLIDEGVHKMNNNFILPMESVETMHMDGYAEEMANVEKSGKKAGRFYKFVKKHILPRRSTSDDVLEIHIVPDAD